MKWFKHAVIAALVLALIVVVHLALPAVLCLRNFGVCMNTVEHVRQMPPSYFPVPVYPFQWHP